MKLMQKVVTAFVSEETADRMKAETEEWQLRCTGCGRTKSLWEAGGIRFMKKSSDQMSATWVRCRTCGGIRMAMVEKVEEER